MKTKLAVCACAVLVVGAVLALRRSHGQTVAATPFGSSGQTPAEEDPRAPVTAIPPAARIPEREPVPRRAPPVAPPPALAELALMASIRELGATDPARALELAREGNRRFPGSADAAERAWTICKSLAALGRFPEAQQEARQAVQKYPETTWASDVKRHLLTQPP